jgi:thiosulfate reductase cytochrome b subunit
MSATPQPANALRHSALVRITHWINAASFIAFVLSGTAILLAYPRLHWGETGHSGMPAWLELPLPLVLELGIRGPGRYLHFLTAWIFLINGLAYLVSGFMTRHFRNDLLPGKSELTAWGIGGVLRRHLTGRKVGRHGNYNVLQRLCYLTVVFLLLPFMFLSGLAMSPTVTSVMPWLVAAMGGQQSARTLHFFAASALLLFFLVHLAMVIRVGFFSSCWAMIAGRRTVTKS